MSMSINNMTINNLELVSDAYRDNPAAADKKFKGKMVRFPFNGRIQHYGEKIIGLWKRTVMIPDPTQPDVHLRFCDDDEAAKVTPGLLCTFTGQCEGLIDGKVVFTNVVLIGEGNLAQE